MCPFIFTKGMMAQVPVLLCKTEKNLSIGKTLSYFLDVYLCVPTVLKLLKMAVGMRALLDTVMQALPQVLSQLC